MRFLLTPAARARRTMSSRPSAIARKARSSSSEATRSSLIMQQTLHVANDAVNATGKPGRNHLRSLPVAHTFEDLVKLERAAEQARAATGEPNPDPTAARQAWIDAAAAFQAAVTEYAAAEGESRVAVEMRVKKTVRHPETDA